MYVVKVAMPGFWRKWIIKSICLSHCHSQTVPQMINKHLKNDLTWKTVILCVVCGVSDYYLYLTGCDEI